MSKLIFITYMNRSGSTFLTSRLNSDKIVSCPESEVLIDKLLLAPFTAEAFSDKQCEEITSERKLKEWEIDIDKVTDILRTDASNIQKFKYILELYKESKSPKAEFILFKGTDTVYNMNEILSSLNHEDCFCIYVLRDPRAVFFSQLNSMGSYTGLPMAVDSEHFSRLWTRHLKSFASGTNSMLVKYETLVTDFDNTFEDVLQFLGLSRKDIKQKAYKTGASQKHLHTNINKAPNQERIDRWKGKLSIYHQHLIETNTSDLMNEYAYEAHSSGVSETRLAFFKSKMRITWFYHSIWSALRFRLKLFK